MATKKRPALNGIIVIQVLLILKFFNEYFLSFINSWWINYELILISHLSQIGCLVFRLLCIITSSFSSLTWGTVHTRRSVVITVAYCGSFHSVVCLTTGPKPLPKGALHIVRSWASSFKWEYPLLSLRSSSIFLRLLPRLPVTSISPFIVPSITCCRRHFLRKMWPSNEPSV
jgi:hypothetical protein